MQKPNLQPDERTLKQFAVLGMLLLGLVVAPWLRYRGHTTAAAVCWATAIVLPVLAMVNQRWVKWPFLAATVITWPIGWVISHVALAAIYYLVFTPVALAFRLIGRDALDRRFDPQATSYWEARDADRDSSDYLRQF